MSAEFDAKNFITVSEEDERLWELLSAYVDGETTAAEAAIVEAHLRSDAAYAQDFAFLKATARQVIHVGEVMPPTELRDAIFAATIHKPTFSRRFAKAFGQLQSAISPRYTLPMGALAAGIFAAFLFVPETADNRPGSGNPAPSVAAITPEIKVEAKRSPVETKPLIPKETPGTQKIAQNDGQPLIALPKQPEIIFESSFIAAPVRENVKTDIAKKPDAPKIVAASASSANKTPSITPKVTTVGIKPNMPVPKTNDMFNDFTPVPNMDRENQRTIARIDPPTEPLLNEDVTPNTTETTLNSNGTETSQASPRVFTVRNTRTARLLPDSRRIATAAQFRTEQSEFQQGISRSTMLAMQRDELSGSTVTRF